MNNDVSVVEMKGLLENSQDLMVVDVRSKDEYATGSIPGAVNIPLPEIASHIKELRSKKIYLICRSGGRSMIALRQLQALGFENVYNIAGGMLAWVKENYPTHV